MKSIYTHPFGSAVLVVKAKSHQHAKQLFIRKVQDMLKRKEIDKPIEIHEGSIEKEREKSYDNKRFTRPRKSQPTDAK